MQRSHYYAIIDEVDSILIDEARTPLIISGPVERTERHHFTELKPVERLMKSQNSLVSELLNEAEKLLAEGKEYEAGIKLLQVKRAAQAKRFLKLSRRAS